ncbi:hypothetical protein [Modestobacter sp. SSW1-42]|uniref:hypothetical protein n=1 Tax=Modestobacter sp. SSW1-42 TaxID=596372 RepID=UPI00398870BB
MALTENVEAVIAAIASTYARCGGTRPKQGAIVAASGLSRSTYARVMREHPEATRALALADSVLDGRTDEEMTSPDDEDDPIRRNPLGAIEELLETITRLTQVIESQKRRIETLEDRLALAPLDF